MKSAAAIDEENIKKKAKEEEDKMIVETASKFHIQEEADESIQKDIQNKFN